MAATLRDVAKAAGVHPGTASRAMNAETAHLVNSVTAKRVQKAARRLGYVPNPIARGLKTSRSTTLGAVIPDITNPLFPPIIRGFEDVVSGSGYSVLIANTDNDPKREHSQIAGLRARQVDGLVIATARLEDSVLEELAAADVPLVLVNRVGGGASVSSVLGDDDTGVRQAVDHLADLGHRRVAYVAGPLDTSTGVARLKAFRQGAQDRGLDLGDELVTDAATYQITDGHDAMNRLCERTQFTAVLAGNDLLAVGCLDALADRGLRCPRDVSVVGFNDIPFVDHMNPPLTTVRLPHYDLGAEAGRVLTELLEAKAEGRPTTAKSVRLPTTLVVRRSTGEPR